MWHDGTRLMHFKGLSDDLRRFLDLPGFDYRTTCAVSAAASPWRPRLKPRLRLLNGPPRGVSDNLRRLSCRTIGQLAPLSGQVPMKSTKTVLRERHRRTIGQLAPLPPPGTDNLRRLPPGLSDNLRRLGSRGIGQLAPKLSDNLRRSAPRHGQLAPKPGSNYRTTCAKLSDNLRRFTPSEPSSTRRESRLDVDNIYS